MADQDAAYEQARKRVEARIGFFVHLGVFVIINVVFLIVVGWDFLWATVFWGLGLALQGWAVFFAHSARVRNWKEQQVAKELARQRGEPAATQPMAPPPAPPPASTAADTPTQPIEE
ncbi:MAG: 2TM domain-containing protein [Acidimicrobiia bacterium]